MKSKTKVMLFIIFLAVFIIIFSEQMKKTGQTEIINSAESEEILPRQTETPVTETSSDINNIEENILNTEDAMSKILDAREDAYNQPSYTKYINTDNIPDEKWIKSFEEKIKEYTSAKIPVIITESWTFENNNIKYTAVNATNIVNYYDAVHEIPSGIKKGTVAEDFVAYKITAVFIDDNEPVFIECFFEDVLPVSINETEDCLTFADDSDALVNIMFKYDAVFYDDNNDVVLYQVYSSESGDFEMRKFRYSPIYMYIDIDDDNIKELIYDRNGFSSWEVREIAYKLTEDSLQKICETNK